MLGSVVRRLLLTDVERAKGNTAELRGLWWYPSLSDSVKWHLSLSLISVPSLIRFCNSSECNSKVVFPCIRELVKV